MLEFGKQRLKRCKYGWMIYSVGSPYIGKCFELYGEYSESEVRVFRNFISEGSTAIDVGANIGSLTVPMSLLCGATGSVYAIESHIDSYHTLCANISLNALSNTKAINAFVSDSQGGQTGGRWGSFISEKWGAPFLSIDALGLDKCDFIKIDVDGNEINVFRSAANTIKHLRPVIYFENEVKDKSPELLEYLIDMGYSMYWHAAPIFDEDNFFGNSSNLWHPRKIISPMVLCIPDERQHDEVDLLPVLDKDDWWDFEI